MTMQFVNTVSKKHIDILYARLLEKNDYTFEIRWNHIISFRKNVLCNHYIFDFAKQKFDQEEQEFDQEKLKISDLFAY